MLKSALQSVADFILPPTCGLCRAVVASEGALCSGCWQSLSFIQAPWCESCGQPFELPTPRGAQCALCLTDAPLYTKARAALVYEEASRQLVSRFKYGDQLHLLPVFKPWLMRAAMELKEGVDLIVPVPLWRWRLWKRKFNQSALLARVVGEGLEIPVKYHALLRIRSTIPQVGMKREQRLKNVRGAFAATPEIMGKVVLLIDDVYTTGATLDACTKALQDAGAQEVRVLTLARVVRPEQIS